MHMNNAHPVDGKKDKVPCDICGKMFTETYLYMHKTNSHSTNVIQCDLCDYTSNSKYKLNIHRKRHFMEKEECPDCGVAVKDLRQHMRVLCKKNTSKGIFSCNECTRTFFKKETLEKHMETDHPKEKKYFCDYCDYRAYKKANIRSHMKKMHEKLGQKVRCEHCNKVTNNLDHHLKSIHAKELGIAAKIVGNEI
eukprot:TRINITY_DN15799_c0_g1_i2.p1 TRINITY_DN15799_c0_g1~~TRINITY_DN15799_c0_g1_i2.p1  ORF type:complete len:214 (+),score=57.19 TRINITY_DN15799_c0_g1_i2:63-644(+)